MGPKEGREGTKGSKYLGELKPSMLDFDSLEVWITTGSSEFSKMCFGLFEKVIAMSSEYFAME